MVTNIYLDSRGKMPGEDAPVKISLSHHRETAYISTNVRVPAECWDAAARCVLPLRKDSQRLNTIILAKKFEVDAILGDLQREGKLRGLRTKTIRDMVVAIIDPLPAYEERGTFIKAFKEFSSYKVRPNTAKLYKVTLNHIKAFEPRYEELNFEDITTNWLFRFDAHMSLTSPSVNSRNINMRNIRAVFNYAIDEELTTFYPFRRFKLKYVPTAKRSFTIGQLRKLWNYEPHTKLEAMHLATFKLIFCLIGINTADLHALKYVPDERLQYTRAKTSKLYDIAVPPEAVELMEQLRGEKKPFAFQERYKCVNSWCLSLCRCYRDIAKELKIPEFTTYWARHTWATIAASLDIPKETIAAALGHSSNSVTDVYIAFDHKKVDEANRKVIDYVLGRA